MNDNEHTARTSKSKRLIAVLRERLPEGTTLELAAIAPRLSDAMWRDVAELADTRPPSQTTVDRVIELLELQVAEDRRITAVKARRPGMVYAA